MESAGVGANWDFALTGDRHRGFSEGRTRGGSCLGCSEAWAPWPDSSLVMIVLWAITEYDRTPGDLMAGMGGKVIYCTFLVFKMAVDFAAEVLSENAEKCHPRLPRTSLADEAVLPKTIVLHRRSKSDASHTYSNHFFFNFEQRPALNVSNSNRISSPVEFDVSSKPLCGKSAPSTTAVDTFTHPRSIYHRAISAGIPGCKVSATAHSYFTSLSSFTAPVSINLDQCRSDIIPTYSMQLYSIKSKYKYAPRARSKLPDGSTVDSWISSAQTPPRLTPSTSFSTPSCGASTPSSCASSVDRVFGVVPRRANPGILSTDCVHDNNQPLSIAFASGGCRAHRLPPVAVIHAVGSVPNVD